MSLVAKLRLFLEQIPRTGVWLGVAGLAIVAIVMFSSFALGRGDNQQEGDQFPYSQEVIQRYDGSEASTPSPTGVQQSPKMAVFASPTPTLILDSTMISSVDSMVMIYVPEGKFIMGSEDGQDDEDPVHSVYLDAFWIDKTEVTNAMFAEFLNEMGNQTEGKGTWLDTEDKENDERIVWKGSEWKPISGYGDHPVTEVTWYGAQAYCEWAGRRLPTEAEWEKAARGTDGRTYPWGNGFNGKLVNYCDIKCMEDWADDEYKDGYAQTAPVGSYPGGASPYGALDLAGNVYEWVSDWFGEDYYYNSPNSNPYGPSHGIYKVHRGGAWWSGSEFVRVANRGYASNYDSDDNVGFRCVLSP